MRDYPDEPLALVEVAQLLWAAQGITSSDGLRAAPSAGALFPLELFLVSGNVANLPAGVYRYRPQQHCLLSVVPGDRRMELCGAALAQEQVLAAPATIVIAAVYSRTTWKYSERGIRYVHMDVGLAAENIYLQATALGLGAVFMGAFHDSEVQRMLSLPPDAEPLCIMPVGRL